MRSAASPHRFRKRSTAPATSSDPMLSTLTGIRLRVVSSVSVEEQRLQLRAHPRQLREVDVEVDSVGHGASVPGGRQPLAAAFRLSSVSS